MKAVDVRLFLNNDASSRHRRRRVGISTPSEHGEAENCEGYHQYSDDYDSGVRSGGIGTFLFSLTKAMKERGF